ncbi:MAG: F0F1 ATP synthase subunit B [Verrucomicrobiota bacterium]
MIVPLILAQGGGIVDRAKDVATQFGGNWTLFFSQVISFLIVAGLLRKFAYKPIIDVLEERRQRIAESLRNADKIKEQLADAEARHTEILTRANGEAQKMIEEARASAAVLAEKRQQQAITEAEQIIVKAREAIELEHERMLADLRREMGRLVVATTAKVTGKILTLDDQKRLAEEATREIAA